MTLSSSIWSGWLFPGRSIKYRNCSHTEYVEDTSLRASVAGNLRQMMVSHHGRSFDWLRLISAAGFPSLATALMPNYVTFPARATVSYDGEESATELTTRRGNFCEVLAAEYALNKMGFEVPIRRLRYNPNPNQAMNGDDILGFRFSRIHGSSVVLLGESKYRSRCSPSVVNGAVEEASRSIYRPRRSYPVSMDFVAGILELERDHERAQWVRQMRAQLQSGQMPVERHYFIFLGTLGRPADPFGWLENQPLIENLTCVNVVFSTGIQSWLNELFGED